MNRTEQFYNLAREQYAELGVDTEQALIDALNLLKGRLTILMIAHRLSTIEQCDRVIRL